MWNLYSKIQTHDHNTTDMFIYSTEALRTARPAAEVTEVLKKN